jgi:cell division septation protein DedD
MAKDYARQFNQQSSKKKSSRKWMVFAMIAVILIIGIGLFIKFEIIPAVSANPKASAFFSRMQTLINHQNTIATNNLDEKPIAENNIHFSFYNELPKTRFEVTKNVETVPAQPDDKKAITKVTTPEKTIVAAPQQPAEQAGYVLQFGVFKDATGANQLRLSLLLAGIETEIAKTQDQYRVQQGPYSGAGEAKSLQQKWQKKGIDSLVKKL